MAALLLGLGFLGGCGGEKAESALHYCFKVLEWRWNSSYNKETGGYVVEFSGRAKAYYTLGEKGLKPGISCKAEGREWPSIRELDDESVTVPSYARKLSLIHI